MRIQCQEGIQNKPLWHKNDFKLKPSEFLKSLICLKAEPLKRTKKFNCHKSHPWEQLLFQKKLVLQPNNHKTIIYPIYSPKVHLAFKKSFFP